MDHDKSVPRKKIKQSIFLRDFKQQKNTAWTPRYRPKTISPMLILYGVLLVPLGVAVLIVSSNNSNDIKEWDVDYTDCTSIKNAAMKCSDYIRSPGVWENYEICQCEVEFELPKPIKGDKIYMYYTLENYHQNTRMYAKSKDDDQLLGNIGTVDKPTNPSKNCDHYDKDAYGLIIYPCGALPNSMFNDSIQLYFEHDDIGEVQIKQNRRGISWSTDLKYRYKNPPEFNDRNHPIWTKFTKPRGWSRTIWDLDPDDINNNGVQNEDFMVWMRPAAFNNFRKLYRIIETPSQDALGDGLPAGTYRLKIDYTYEVASFNGRKGVTLSTTTIFGQQNMFQGLAIAILGGISTLLGLLFLICGCTTRLGKGSFTRPGCAETESVRFRNQRDALYILRRRRAKWCYPNHFPILSAFKIFIFVIVCGGLSLLILMLAYAANGEVFDTCGANGDFF